MSSIFQSPTYQAVKAQSELILTKQELMSFYKRHQVVKTEAEVDGILQSKSYRNAHLKLSADLMRKYGAPAPQLRKRREIEKVINNVISNDTSDVVIESTPVEIDEDGLSSANSTGKGYEWVRNQKQSGQGLLTLDSTADDAVMVPKPAATADDAVMVPKPAATEDDVVVVPKPAEAVDSPVSSPNGKDFVQVKLETEVWGCPNCGCKQFLTFDEKTDSGAPCVRRICAECEHQKV